MILGMSLARFTQVHVAISLIGIAAGFLVIFGMMASKKMVLWTELFLITTALTSITGFMFPFKGVTPGIVIGILSLVVLLFAVIFVGVNLAVDLCYVALNPRLRHG